jgi:hypothetical protein
MMIELGLHVFNNSISTIDFSSLNLAHFQLDWNTFFAQIFQQDVTKDLVNGWNNFVKTGQIWALLIGVTLGYLFKSITSF